MPIWAQHLLVLLLVAACVTMVAWQFVRTFRGEKSKLGSCCAKGCDAAAAAAAKPPAGDRVAFLPAEMLSVTRRRDGGGGGG